MTLPDVDTLSTYGGALVNGGPVVDPTTDRDAGAMNEALESVAQLTHTAARAVCRVALAAVSPSVTFADAGWGNSTPPTIAASTTGLYLVTWPGFVTDGLGESHALNLRWATVQLESGGTFPGFAFPSVFTANVVKVYCFNSSFALNYLAGQTAIIRVG